MHNLHLGLMYAANGSGMTLGEKSPKQNFSTHALTGVEIVDVSCTAKLLVSCSVV